MVQSIVDYAAWEKGYMPPSEHILIDALSYRGAKVIFATDYGEVKPALWLVMRGKRPPRKIMKAMVTMMFDCLDEEDECSPEMISQATSPTTTEAATAEPTAITAWTGMDGSMVVSASAGAAKNADTGTLSKDESETK